MPGAHGAYGKPKKKKKKKPKAKTMRSRTHMLTSRRSTD